MTLSKIGWTERVWNPTTGCNKVSQGCKNCYAEGMHKRLMGMYPKKYNRPFLDGAFEHEDSLTLPDTWKKPALVFVNSMSDLFHENISFEFISSVFSVMSDIDRHTYQILTKRPERVIEFFAWKEKQLDDIFWRPSDNVWIGVSVEDQATFDLRVPLLREIRSSVKFLSCEPLLGSIDLYKEFPVGKGTVAHGTLVDWVIVGGESGSKARPMHPDWVRLLRDQCAYVNIPFFFKQWGEYADGSNGLSRTITILSDGDYCSAGWEHSLRCRNNHVMSSDEWYAYSPIRMSKVGKNKSGRLLDGVEHNGMPVQFKGGK